MKSIHTKSLEYTRKEITERLHSKLKFVLGIACISILGITCFLFFGYNVIPFLLLISVTSILFFTIRLLSLLKNYRLIQRQIDDLEMKN